ncbi:MAG: 30S ribosomal protein S16 [candidate division WOR-3 bacterium]|nr:30S ribosomal protein S16 [candidate division WOR-3 bacterium]MCX7757941.1 30S ribosomal protein S16 [candidate division WOR-3 bacterium]
MVKIRLKRIGRKNAPLYRIVVADSRRARDGKYLETVGHYNPKTKHLSLNLERVDYWLSKGAQATETTKRLITRYKNQTKPQTVQETLGGIRSENEQGGDHEGTD